MRIPALRQIACALLDAVGVPPLHTEVPVATAGPMSGQYTWFGAQIQQGAEVAVARFRAGGFEPGGYTLQTYATNWGCAQPAERPGAG